MAELQPRPQTYQQQQQPQPHQPQLGQQQQQQIDSWRNYQPTFPQSHPQFYGNPPSAPPSDGSY